MAACLVSPGRLLYQAVFLVPQLSLDPAIVPADILLVPQLKLDAAVIPADIFLISQLSLWQRQWCDVRLAVLYLPQLQRR